LGHWQKEGHLSVRDATHAPAATPYECSQASARETTGFDHHQFTKSHGSPCTQDAQWKFPSGQLESGENQSLPLPGEVWKILTLQCPSLNDKPAIVSLSGLR